MKLIVHHNESSGLFAPLQQHSRTSSHFTVSAGSSASCPTITNNASSDDDLPHLQQHPSQRNNRKVLRFAPVQPSQCYDNTKTRKEIEACWYSKAELAQYRRETLKQAETITREKHQEQYIQNLAHMYDGFCHVQTAADVQRLLNTNMSTTANQSNTDDNRLLLELVGLDRLLVPALARDKVERRHRILKQVQFLQSQNACSHYHAHGAYDTLAARITTMSRSVSQPSRLYAHYLAHQQMMQS